MNTTNEPQKVKNIKLRETWSYPDDSNSIRFTVSGKFTREGFFKRAEIKRGA